MDKQKKTIKLYSNMVEREWGRLQRDAFHKLEYNTTLEFLKKHLPKDGLVLDAGGGPGRYTIALAKLGYKVVLYDLVDANLKYAKIMIKEEKVEDKVQDVIQGKIEDLSNFLDNSFDAVICLGGPLSHVYSEELRTKAVSELARVAKKDAPIFISVMGKFGTLMNALTKFPDEITMKEHFEDLAYRGEDDCWMNGEGHSHFFTRDELEGLFYKNKIKIIEEVGLEGLASTGEDAASELAEARPEVWQNWLDVHKELCTHPTIVDSSLHFMLIGKKS